MFLLLPDLCASLFRLVSFCKSDKGNIPCERRDIFSEKRFVLSHKLFLDNRNISQSHCRRP